MVLKVVLSVLLIVLLIAPVIALNRWDRARSKTMSPEERAQEDRETDDFLKIW
jgi:hypothetical protein